jgi:hypothetical protein
MAMAFKSKWNKRSDDSLARRNQEVNIYDEFISRVDKGVSRESSAGIFKYFLTPEQNLSMPVSI